MTFTRSMLTALTGIVACAPPQQTHANFAGTATLAASIGGWYWYRTAKKNKIWQHPKIQELLKPGAAHKIVIFDMGGVVVNLHKTFLGINKVGIKRITSYFVTHLQTPGEIKEMIFDLYDMPDKELNCDDTVCSSLKAACNNDGSRLPKLVAAYQMGLISSEAARQLIAQKSDQCAATYASTTEKDIILALAQAPFEPEHFAQHISPIPEGIKLLQALKKAGHTTMILSNWDRESFAYLKRTYKSEIFDHVADQNVIVSGDVQMLKPAPNIFALAAQRAGCAPADCVFFDDQPENTAAAQESGMHAVQCTW